MVIWSAFRMGNYRVNDHPYHAPQFNVGCVFPMTVVSRLPHAEFGLNDHRRDAPFFGPLPGPKFQSSLKLFFSEHNQVKEAKFLHYYFRIVELHSFWFLTHLNTIKLFSIYILWIFLTELNKQVDLCWIQGPGFRIWQKPVWTGNNTGIPVWRQKGTIYGFYEFFNFLLFRDREERNLNDLLNLKNLHSVLKA